MFPNDESMIAFKGRSMLKQYMPNKPNKRGYKVWCLADSTTGFITGFIALVKWMDRKAVNFISTFDSPRQTTTVSRRLRDGTRIDVHCPKVVETYNKYMGGVDRFDQMLECYAIGRRSVKWWHRIFYYLLDLAIVNSYVLWKLVQPDQSKCNHLTFRMKVARQLINGFTNRKTLGRPPNFVKSDVPEEVRLVNVGCHFPKKTLSRRRCKFCSGKNKRKEHRTYFTCGFCQVPLCVENCFEKFHRK